MSDFQSVLYSVTNRVATIKMNRPKAMNAFDNALRIDLLAAIQKADQDDDVRVVIITGEGKGFSAGHDLQNAYGGYDTIEECILKEYKPFLMAVYESDKLFISAVNGAAAGIGGALALTCDFTVMSEKAYIYQAFAAIALVPDGGASFQLVNYLGYKRALQMIVESGRLQANECLAAGMANKVVAADDLLSESQAWAEKLSQGAPISQRLSKKLLQNAVRDNLESVVDKEAAAQNLTSSSEDFMTAATAFFNKEVPVFKGK